LGTQGYDWWRTDKAAAQLKLRRKVDGTSVHGTGQEPAPTLRSG
jgi:hypothetical protein